MAWSDHMIPLYEQQGIWSDSAGNSWLNKDPSVLDLFQRQCVDDSIITRYNLALPIWWLLFHQVVFYELCDELRKLWVGLLNLLPCVMIRWIRIWWGISLRRLAWLAVLSKCSTADESAPPWHWLVRLNIQPLPTKLFKRVNLSLVSFISPSSTICQPNHSARHSNPTARQWMTSLL